MISMKFKWVEIFAVFSVVFVMTGCQRSRGFKQDQEFYTDTPTYFNKSADAKGKSPTQRIESMGQPRKRVVVFDFWNDTPVKAKDVGAFASEELRRGLHLTQRLILPADAKSELSTEDFIQGDKVRVAQLIREGRRMGVAALVIGRISKVVFRQRGDDVGLLRQAQSLAAVDVEIKIFDVNSGREIFSGGRSGESASNSLIAFEQENIQSAEYRAELTRLAARSAVGNLVQDVIKSIEKLSWEGRIAKIIGSKVYVNAGKSSGIIGGDILKVLTPGDDIYDPLTSAYLGRTPGQLKGTLEVIDFLGPDGAVSEVHTGGNFQEGDSVRLY